MLASAGCREIVPSCDQFQTKQDPCSSSQILEARDCFVNTQGFSIWFCCARATDLAVLCSQHVIKVIFRIIHGNLCNVEVPFFRWYELLTINLDTVLNVSEGLLFVHQRTRQRLSKDKLSFCLPGRRDVPLCVHLFVHHTLVVLKVATKTFGFEGCPDCDAQIRQQVLRPRQGGVTHRRIDAFRCCDRTLQDY